MKSNHVVLALICLSLSVSIQLAAQQSEVDRKLLAEIRAEAEKGDAAAQFNLGACYDKGEGVAKEEMEAVKWYRKAADLNDAKAQHNLGVSYYNGRGVAKDSAEAYKWLLLAEAQGHEIAKKNSAVLETRLTREQVTEGRKRASNFKPQEVPSAGGDGSSVVIAQTRPGSSNIRMKAQQSEVDRQLLAE